MARMSGDKTTDVAKVETDASVPAYLQGNTKGTMGMQSMGKDDVVLPRIKLLQGLSEEVTNEIPGAKSGDFWHTLMEQSLGDNFTFVIANDKKRYMLLAPLADGQGVLARAEDGVHWDKPDSEFQVKIKGVKQPVTWKIGKTVDDYGANKFGSFNPDDPDSPPAATLFYEYLIYLPDHPELSPVVMSLARSQIKKAKRELNSKVEMQANLGRPREALVFKATKVQETSDEGPYWNYRFNMAGFADEATFNKVCDISEKYKDYRVHDEDKMASEASGAMSADVEDKAKEMRI